MDLWNDFVTVGCKIDSSDNRLDYIIVSGGLRDITRRLELHPLNPGSFPLCHADLSVNNIYVDDDYNITCIIDWAFSSSVPENMLLTPPGLPQSRDELSPELQKSFIEGFVSAIPESLEKILVDRCRKSLEEGQFSWVLTRLLNFDSIGDYNLLATIWDFAYGPEDLGQYFMQQRLSSHNTPTLQ